MDSPVVPETGDPSRTPPGWPRIADYWPDAPHRLGPPADHYELPGVDATRTGPALHTRPAPAAPPGFAADDRTERDLKPVLVLLAAVLLVGGGVFAAVSNLRTPASDPIASLPAPPLPVPSVVVEPSRPPVSIAAAPPPSKAGTRPSATAPGGGAGKRTTTPPPALPETATLEIADGVTQLQVWIADLDDGLAQVGVGDDSAIKARAAVDGDTVTVSVEPSGRRSGSARLQIRLNDDVRWSFRMRAGVREASLDLSGGPVGEVELIGGASTVDLALPAQRDPIPVVERGGLGTWRIVTGDEVPVRAFLRRGAGAVTLYGAIDDSVSPGDVLRAGRGDGGIRLDSEKGVGALSVQAR